MLEWTQNLDKEPGDYWFYGAFLGSMGEHFADGFEPKPQLVLVKLHEVHYGFTAVGEGRFLPHTKFDRDQRREGYVGYWAKTTLPNPPEDIAGLFTKADGSDR